MNSRSELYQVVLIVTSVVVMLLVGAFIYFEAFPEYKVYQETYVKMEEFRSTYTKEPPPEFSFGIKQILLPSNGLGPQDLDRCISCHVATQFPHFSPTRIAMDANGDMRVDDEGHPILEPNPDYCWLKLDEKVAELTDEKVNQRLSKEGKQGEVNKRLEQAKELRHLRYQEVDGVPVDMSKVISMHPLIGKEVRPFEYHPIEEYGCTSCHSGDGQSVTAKRAHGPVYDGTYEFAAHSPISPFLERDKDNDPLFAKEYNARPGHELVFQTTPILVGNLMEAKCVQCHQLTERRLRGVSELVDQIASEKQKENVAGAASQEVDNVKETFRLLAQDKSVIKEMSSDVDGALGKFKRGEDLYFTQACYSCHTIAGLSRGSVGPELTSTGLGYPWYIKLSIMWPQGKLPTSKMPNFKLDHEEVEDLMTFLLAQRNEEKTVGAMEKKLELKAWSSGKKSPWEMPVAPTDIVNVQAGMIVFATEGCSACHKLKGFDSDVGYALEKKPHDNEQLADEREWFGRLFPEHILGSQIVEVLDKNAAEIDRHIVHDVRKGSILEEIDAKYPHAIEALYTSFKYALRAKNHEYQTLVKNASNDAQKQEALAQLDAWKERVYRVLMMYIQEYGYGRDVAPRLHWAGIYRDDEWLLGHFHNPGDYTARSIMPPMPFDDTKFYSLTHMLRVLGKRNRDALRELWDLKGFNPAVAYQLLCSACHGEFKRGDGFAAEVIYPIPKDLTNATFLRNYTKPREIQSVTHGVKGTPMPPWGETIPNAEKAIGDDIPVLTHSEISLLVDWIYQSLSGREVVEEKDVLKWQYTPGNILDELKKEDSPSHESLFEGVPSFSEEHDVAALNKELTVQKLFDVEPNPVPGGVDEHAYYIKKEFYTPENIAKGQQLFTENCSICHGKYADGTGERAAIMTGAKPRMLTNIPWLRTRDDLRLLRSIKFGVPGTAMTPWGDLTTASQRMQLVIFIQSLSSDRRQRDDFAELLFAAFDEAKITIEDARIKEYSKLESVKQSYEQAVSEQQALIREVKNGLQTPEIAALAYIKQLTYMDELQHRTELDNLLIALIEELKKERNTYEKLGLSLISRNLGGNALSDYFEIIKLNNGRYADEEGMLAWKSQPELESQIAQIRQRIVDLIDQKIAFEKRKIEILQGKLYSSEVEKELHTTKTLITGLTSFRAQLLEELVSIEKSLEKQKTIYENYRREAAQIAALIHAQQSEKQLSATGVNNGNL